VVTAVPDSAENAVVRVTGAKSGLAYLDTLLHQRMQGDAVWSGLSTEEGSGLAGQDMRYVLPEGIPDEAWVRLGAVVRGWKNPVGVRMTTNRRELTQATQKAVAVAEKLSNSGVMSAFVEVKIDEKPGTPVAELVVRAQ
jgi:hypothetical protein